LQASSNPLAIPLQLRCDGQALLLTRKGLAAAIPDATGKVLLLVHGLCMNDLEWRRNGHDHGAALAAEAGFTPVYLHYNSGLHVSTNGRAFAEQIQTLLHAWPVPVDELVILAHSMGGLLARSACHYAELAQLDWRQHLRKIIFLGTPHHGAPLERGGNWVDMILDSSPYTTAFARLGKIRSAGITDLRHGNLLDADWEHHDRFARSHHKRPVVPLPRGVACYAIAASMAKKTGEPAKQLLGDGLVPLASALGQHEDAHMNLAFPKSRQWVGYGMNHMDLLDREEVYERIKRWV
jgi:pimeloyl-ACP methyl ester carboxylesterase